MTETNQEDLSVEDILSSIKNILVDDNSEDNKEKQSAVELPKVPQQTTSETKEDDDVFELDSSMIIKEDSKILEQMLQKQASTQNNSTAPEDIASSIDINQTLAMAQEIDLSTLPALDNLLKPTTPSAPVKNEVEETTIDASANIINNFAKLFAEKQQTQTATQVSAADSVENSNISNLIKTTITEQVKTNLNADFERIATNIIAEQAKLWLNQNLASIVEKIVAAEIARVIAKVGS